MNVIQHTKYVWELENFIPDEQIDYFLGAFDFHNPPINSRFRNKVRANDTYDINEYQDLDNLAWKWINDSNRYYVFSNKWVYYNWNVNDLLNNNTWKGRNIIRIYNEKDTYHWHGDQSPENLAEFSYIVYLNDDFEGGRTLFLNEKLAVSPKKGSVLCFPVDHYHIHKGTRVTSGAKKILWNCVYRHEIQMMGKQPYLTAVNAPRSSRRCIW